MPAVRASHLESSEEVRYNPMSGPVKPGRKTNKQGHKIQCPICGIELCGDLGRHMRGKHDDTYGWPCIFAPCTHDGLFKQKSNMRGHIKGQHLDRYKWSCPHLVIDESGYEYPCHRAYHNLAALVQHRFEDHHWLPHMPPHFLSMPSVAEEPVSERLARVRLRVSEDMYFIELPIEMHWVRRRPETLKQVINVANAHKQTRSKYARRKRDVDLASIPPDIFAAAFVAQFGVSSLKALLMPAPCIAPAAGTSSRSRVKQEAVAHPLYTIPATTPSPIPSYHSGATHVSSHSRINRLSQSYSEPQFQAQRKEDRHKKISVARSCGDLREFSNREQHIQAAGVPVTPFAPLPTAPVAPYAIRPDDVLNMQLTAHGDNLGCEQYVLPGDGTIDPAVFLPHNANVPPWRCPQNVTNVDAPAMHVNLSMDVGTNAGLDYAPYYYFASASSSAQTIQTVEEAVHEWECFLNSFRI